MIKKIFHFFLPLCLAFNTAGDTITYEKKPINEDEEVTILACDHFINTPSNFYTCDYDNDSIEQFDIDLEALENEVIGNQTGLTISYHSATGVTLDLTEPGNQLAVNQRRIWVRLTNSDGCYKETTFDLILESPLTANKFDDVVVCENYTLPSLSPNNQYYTAINAGGTMLNEGDFINTDQTIYIYASSNSCENQSQFKVTIDPNLCEEAINEVCLIEFPKFITPNNDGINDSFRPLENNCERTGTLYIYDRYGKLLKQFDATNGSWKGNYRGTALPASDYWYRFVSNVSNQELNGHFSLKR